MIEKLIKELSKYKAEDIASSTGYSFSSIRKLMSGENTNPTIKFVEALQKFLQENK